MKPPEALLVNQLTLSLILGLAQPTVSILVSKGMPHIPGENLHSTRYNLFDCIPWVLRHKTKDDKTDFQKAQIRKLLLEGDKLELELSERRNEVIEMAKVSHIWSNVLSEFKTRLLDIPKKMSSLFDGLSNAFELEVLLEETLFDALTELSRAENLTLQLGEKK
jgi:phage terminase Nu1 subunit (DNA packaging protein)